MGKAAYALLVLIPALIHGLEVVPDSVVVSATRSISPIGRSVILHNPSDAGIRIDSITIRFLDGDTAGPEGDFNKCKACPPENRLLYSGWTYWDSPGPPFPLRYVKDSLYKLDSLPGPSVGNRIPVRIPPRDSVHFPVAYIINCPVCNRMPSFPTTNHYLFTFFLSDQGRAEFHLTYSRPPTVLAKPMEVAPERLSVPHDARGKRLSGKGFPFEVFRYPTE